MQAQGKVHTGVVLTMAYIINVRLTRAAYSVSLGDCCASWPIAANGLEFGYKATLVSYGENVAIDDFLGDADDSVGRGEKGLSIRNLKVDTAMPGRIIACRL